MKRRFTETRGFGLVENGTFSKRTDYDKRVVEFLVGSHGKAHIIHVGFGKPEQFTESALFAVGFVPTWIWDHYKHWHNGMFGATPNLANMSVPEYMDRCPAGRRDKTAYKSQQHLKRAFEQFCNENRAQYRLVG